MTQADIARLVALGALWGASFLFMRVSVPEFGPIALVFVRTGLAAALLLPWLALRDRREPARAELAALRRHWRPIAVVGVINTALPFSLFAVGALALGAGLMAVFNSTAALWAALIAWGWLGVRPARWQMAGLVVGVAGVAGLSWDKATLKAGELPISPAIAVAACLLATVLYGFAGNYTRRALAGVPPMAVAAGSQIASTAVLLVPALVLWPAAMPSPTAWGSTVVLAVASTALAYALYFRLIADVGATKAVSVSFLIPIFAMAWGAAILGERPTPAMLIGCAVILAGTALSTGLVDPARRLQRKRGCGTTRRSPGSEAM